MYFIWFFKPYDILGIAILNVPVYPSLSHWQCSNKYYVMNNMCHMFYSNFSHSFRPCLFMMCFSWCLCNRWSSNPRKGPGYQPDVEPQLQLNKATILYYIITWEYHKSRNFYALFSNLINQHMNFMQLLPSSHPNTRITTPPLSMWYYTTILELLSHLTSNNIFQRSAPCLLILVNRKLEAGC